MKKIIYIVLFLSVLLVGCRSKNVSTNAKQVEDIEVKNDIEQKEKEQIKESVKTNLEGFIDENIEVVVEKVVYDTEKPIDINTGKHPIKEVVKATVNKKKKTEQKEEVIEERLSASENTATDNSTTKIATEEQVYIEEETPLSTLEVLSICAVIALFLFVLYKIIRWFKK